MNYASREVQIKFQTPEASYALAEVHRYKVQDATLAVRTFGNGANTVLFIHGFPVHGYTWRKLLPKLAERFTCYVVDLPGLGDSEWTSSTDFTFTAQTRRLRLLTDQLALKQYALVAHDTGATVARLLALAEPQRVTKLVIINTEMPGHRPPWITFYRNLALLPGAGQAFRTLLGFDWFTRSPLGLGAFYSDSKLLNEPSYLEPYVKPLVTSSHNIEGALHFLRGIEWKVVDNLRKDHAKIKARTLLLWGEDDPTFPVTLGEQMCNEFGGTASFVRIARAALMPHEEQPDALLNHLVPFLA
ncbi:MAG: alpha/beta hydrolase [Acidobacteriota bacterium]